MKLMSGVAAFQTFATAMFLLNTYNQWKEDKRIREQYFVDNAHVQEDSEDFRQSIEYLSFRKQMVKHERDVMLSLACLLSHALIFVVCYSKDKFERYVQFRDEQEGKLREELESKEKKD